MVNMNVFMAPVAILLLVAASNCVLVAVDAAAIVKADGYSFEMYVKEFGKQYGSTEEFDMRKDLFLARRDMVAEHNRKYDAGKSSYKRAINHLSDRTEDELKQIKGLDSSLLHFQKHRQSAAKIAERKRNLADAKTLEGLPASVDWREKGIISPVKNQVSCIFSFHKLEKTLTDTWAGRVWIVLDVCVD